MWCKTTLDPSNLSTNASHNLSLNPSPEPKPNPSLKFMADNYSVRSAI